MICTLFPTTTPLSRLPTASPAIQKQQINTCTQPTMHISTTNHALSKIYACSMLFWSYTLAASQKVSNMQKVFSKFNDWNVYLWNSPKKKKLMILHLKLWLATIVFILYSSQYHTAIAGITWALLDCLCWQMQLEEMSRQEQLSGHSVQIIHLYDRENRGRERTCLCWRHYPAKILWQ